MNRTARRSGFVFIALCVIVLLPACDRALLPGDKPGLSEIDAELRLRAQDFDFNQGQWHDDYGDAAFFGMAFYVNAGKSERNPGYLKEAERIRSYNLSVLTRGLKDMTWALANFEEVMMATLGLIEYAGVSGDHTDQLPIQRLADRLNAIVRTMGDYADLSFGQFAADTYGPTAMTAGLALLNLQIALYFSGERTTEFIEKARSQIAATHEKVWDGQRYRFRPSEQKLFLYPNSIMIIVLCRMYQLTGERTYLEQAERTVEGIEALRDPIKGNYRSPYSQLEMGAKTDDYSTLSSQNYLSMGLMLLYQHTRNPLYLERTQELLFFSWNYLWDQQQGKILHHWIDGHIALPTDPAWFCSGCNLQYLYLLWYLDSVVLA